MHFDGCEGYIIMSIYFSDTLGMYYAMASPKYLLLHKEILFI